ncbi:MAG: PCMD domain-containing protein [Rikenellaceae bacterium]|nr:PCMD domain-containing protein [Rikenellaceae bacterium]
MNKIKHIAFALLGLLCCTSCIKNTIPYPVVEIEILQYEGEGFRAQIDPLTRTVTLTLDEQTDITAVEVTNVQITDEGTASTHLTGTFDMRTPMEVTLSLYQDYVWTIQAVQPIERYFTVAGQIGPTEIDPESYTATVYVAEGTDLEQIRVTSLKLGPKDVTTMTPSIEELTSFSSVRYVYLQYPSLKGAQERWQLYVLETDVKVTLTQADAWAKVAWLYGAAEEGTRVGFRYRKVGEEAWSEVTNVSQTGGTFTAKVTGLTPDTEYEFLAYSNEDLSPTVIRRTEQMAQLENSGFEDWCVVNEIVYPYAEGGSPFWATGNVGASLVKATVTEGVSDIRPGSSGRKSARLTSIFANIFGIGRFAAGNLYVGNYVRNDGTHGIINFGRPFTARPVALRGWVKYTCGAIDRITTQPPGVTIEQGDMDCGSIYLALGDWDPAIYGGTADSPVEVATRRIDETAFNPNSEAVIAYGELLFKESVDGWTEFTIPLDYRATDRIPTHIFVVCAASRYGDYFTGSTSSVMWVDDFELIYE